MGSWYKEKKELQFKTLKNLNVSQKAFHARELLKNPLFIEIIKDIEIQTFDIWKRCETKENREMLWLSMQVIEKIKYTLESYISNALYEEKKFK